MRYIITKKSRLALNTPYRGPTCMRAGVESSKVYDDRTEAQKDADKLTYYNSVGFRVEEYQESN